MKCPNSFRFLVRSFQAAAAAGLAFVLSTPARAQSPTLLLRIPFTDTNSSTTSASDTSTGGANVALQMIASNGQPANFHGAQGSGVSALGVALNLSNPGDFTAGAGEGAQAGIGPLVAVTNTALNFGAVGSFTATIWFNPNAQVPNTGGNSTLGARIFTLGANGITDKGAANSIGLYFQQWNQIEGTINTATIAAPVLATPFVPTNQWQFYAITYDGSTATIYSGTDGSAAAVAGSQALAGATVTLNNAGGSVLYIGNRQNLARSFDGWINDFRFYTNAASANFVEDIRWSSLAPTNVTGSISNNAAVLTWNALPGAATYNVSRSTTSGGPYAPVLSGLTSPSFADSTPLSPNTTYYYVVSAVNANGDQTTSANSAEASVPSAPLNVVGTLADGGITLTWSDTDVNGYTVLRATSPGGPYSVVATGITGTSFTDSNAVSGTQFYYYEVVGINANGSTAPSSVAAVSYGQGNQLADPGFEDFTTPGPWAEVGNQGGNGITVTPGPTYYNAGECPADNPAEQIVTHSGNNVAKIYGSFLSASEFVSSYKQQVSATPLGTWAAGGWTYSPHEDLIAANDSFYYEVDFLDVGGNLISAYQSFMVTNMSCGGPNTFPLDTWVFLATTNQMQVVNGLNTGVVVGSTGSSGIMTAPAGTASVRFNALYDEYNYGGGSIYFDDCELDLVNGSLPPSLSLANLNNLTLCTNTTLEGTAISTGGTITNVQAIITANAFGTTITNKATNNINADTSGLGTSTAVINCPLTSNTVYTITILATDNRGNIVSGTESFDTITPSLVIEATDFNYSGGGFTDTAANGGVFVDAGQVGVEEVDEHKNTGNQSTRAPYRNSDEAVIQVANSVTINEQKYGTNFASAEAVELCIDYASTADWFNYTRTYGPSGSAPAGTYDVYLCLGTSGSGPQASLYQIDGDPASQTQVTNFAGYFGTSSFAENSWAGYEYVPLTDQYGNLQSITIPAGPQTLRVTEIANPNLDYLILMPKAPVLTPSFAFFYPDGAHPFEATNSLSFTVGPANGSNIASSGISLVLNGVNVSSSPNFHLVNNGGVWTASYPLQLSTVYTAFITVSNTAGLSSSLPLSFDTFDVNDYQWEAVDYDFTTNGPGGLGGSFIDNPVPTCDGPQTGQFATNSYFGYPMDLIQVAIAQQQVDINFGNSGQSAPGSEVYRNDGVGSQPASDYVRPKFVAAQKLYNDPNIGPINIGYYAAGYWLNYTRHYPTNDYYIWGRLAGGSAYSGTDMDMVTSGVGTASQTLLRMGTFADPNASGYQSWHWIPLLDTNGNKVIASLGGQATFRVTSGNNLNLEFFMLVPAPPQFRVTPSLVAGQLNLSFPTQLSHTYNVLYKPNLNAVWAPIGSPITGTGSAASVNETLSGSQGYYSVSVQ
ncbi:MAG TPA: LamG-like jellyroll fold domain-containing protein [Verrucomicrobiae bacterium]|jgi:hypothetical protein